MNTTAIRDVSASLCLRAATAADLMAAPPMSISETALVQEAIVFLADRGFGAAPVINEAGRPVGVVSKSDIVRYEREETQCVSRLVPSEGDAVAATADGECLDEGFEIKRPDRTRVREIMTPMVFSVSLNASARDVVAQMLKRNVHRLFVVDDAGVLVGIITAMDVLRHLG
jgi:CBS domain-containing protein